MNRVFAALLALPVLAAPAAAQQCGHSGFLNFGFGANVTLTGHYAAGCGSPPCCGGGGGGAPAQLGPWYLYWPYEANFQTPAPTGYPFWPGPQTLPNGMGALPPGGGAGLLQPAAYAPGTPSYWYGR